jgi:hypothetical protein
MKIRIFSTLLFLYANFIFASPMPIVFPFLSIIPEKNTVNVINARTVMMTYTVVNNLSYRVNEIIIDPTFEVTSDVISIQLVKNTCEGAVVSAYDSCSFTLALKGKNQTGKLTLSPKLCMFSTQNCSRPLPNNVLHVTAKVLRSIKIASEKSAVEVGKTQSFSAVADYSDNSKDDVTTDVLWRSSNNGIATINPKTGIVTGVSSGNTNMTATSDNITSNSVTITVTPKTADV